MGDVIQDSVETTSSPGLRRGSIGVLHIVFFVIATAGPLVSLVGAAPAAIAFGNGIGLPGSYLLITLLYLLFSVGYTAMSRRITNAGAFYAYIAEGLGPAWGLGGALVAILAYSAVQIGTYALLGIFCQQGFVQLAGIHAPWWQFALAAALLVEIIGQRTIVFSGRVLGALLILEVLIVLILDGAIIGSRASFSWNSFAPSHVFAAGFGASLAFVVPCFLGFEATAIFGEEADNPKRTIPIATYVSVLVIGGIYAVSSWSIIAAYPASNVVRTAAEHGSTLFFDVAGNLLGRAAVDAMTLLMITSMFAALLSLHNAIARYFFALARAGMLPTRLAQTHIRHQSPHIAGYAQTMLSVALIGLFALLETDAYGVVFAWSAALAALSILAVQCIASLSVFGFFRCHPHGHTCFTTIIAPLASAAGLAACGGMLVANLPLIAGTDAHGIWALPITAVLVGLTGMFLARRHATSAADLRELET